ncbi:MAG: hypothetical protein KF809_09240 [Chloroflexi bacterium]|nr:hypothetical protein [Chloroflexota bacterium]
MIAVVLVLLGIVAVGVAAVMLRVVGSGYRIGRLLAAAPEMPLATVTGTGDGAGTAVGAGTGVVAGTGSGAGTDHADATTHRAGSTPGTLPAGYLRVTGRVSSEQEFPDDMDRPLVFRRTRLQTREGRSWRTIDDDRIAVPFGIEERGAYVAVDLDALGDGLVVVPRVATGVASDLPDAMRPTGIDLPPDRPVRVRIDQLSAVEHATVAGVVARGPDGTPTLTAGAGRPLIVTSLAPAEAMRVLAGEDRGLVRLAAMLLVLGLGLIAAAIVAFLLGW